MKTVSITSAIALAAAGAASAQGLYNIMPYDDEPLDAIPITWIASLSVGYDDNATPTGTELPGVSKNDSAYVSASLQANYVSVQPQTTWDAWARVGGTYYFDELPQAGTGGGMEDTYWDLGAGLNVVHRATERLRFRSRTSVSYQVEPDYTSGITPDRRQGQYFRYSSDNSVGYSWTERFGTVTGYRIHGVIYDDLDGNDYMNHLFYNQFRYRLSPATVLTASVRFSTNDNESGRDSDSYFALVGAEHRFSPNTVGVIRVGAQFFDGVESSTAPYVEAMLRTRTNEQFSIRGFVRYGIEDRGTGLTYQDVPGLSILGFYDERTTFRFGAQATYDLSPTVSIYGGANVVLTGYDEQLPGPVGPGGPAPSSFDEEVFNASIGASYRVMENVFVNGTYNYTNSSSDGKSREYDRNRFNLGVRTTF